MRNLLHLLSICATCTLVFCVLYGAQMYYFNMLGATKDWLPARIGAAILSVLIIWKCFTFSSAWKP
jgi:hypothetical protein